MHMGTEDFYSGGRASGYGMRGPDRFPSRMSNHSHSGRGTPAYIPGSGGAEYFYFKERRGRVDWRLIAPIDVNRLMRDGDIDSLQSLLETITFADIESEAQHRYADPEFVKIIRICQLAIEYLLHVQDVLDAERAQLRDQAQNFNDDMLELNNQLAKSKEEVSMLKRDIHNKKKMIANLEMMLKLPASSARLPDGRIYKCPLCNKIFASYQYVENHIFRRHPDQANTPLVTNTLAQYQNDSIWQSQSELNKKEKEDETQMELRQLRELKEKLMKDTERLAQSEREMKSKLDEQLELERQNLRKKEDELEKANLEQRLKYEEELRNFQSTLRKEFFDHKMQVLAEQQKKETESRPRSSVGMLESDDEEITRKTAVQAQVNEAVAKMKEDFDRQMKAMQEKALRDQEQTQQLLQEERKRVAQEKKRTLEQAQQEKERLEKEKERERERERQERERAQQELEREKAEHEQKLKKKMKQEREKEKEKMEQKEKRLREEQERLEQERKRHAEDAERQRKEEEEAARRKRLAEQKKKKKPVAEPREVEEPISLSIPTVPRYTPFPERPYLKALFDHSPIAIEEERAEFVANLHEELEALGVPATGMGIKELERFIGQIDADREQDEETLQHFPLDEQFQMQNDLRLTMDDIADQYFVYEEPPEDFTPPRPRISNASPNAKKPPPSPTPSRKLSQQLAHEAVSKRGNLRASTESLRSSLKNSSSSINLPPSPTPNKKVRIGHSKLSQEQDLTEGEEEEDDMEDDLQEEDEEEVPFNQKMKPKLQQQQIKKQQPTTTKQAAPAPKITARTAYDDEDEDEDFDDEGDDEDLQVSNSNTSAQAKQIEKEREKERERERERERDREKERDRDRDREKEREREREREREKEKEETQGFRTSTELASFEVSEDEDDLSSLRDLAKRNQPPKAPLQVTSVHSKDDDFDDDLDSDIYATPSSKFNLPKDQDNDISDFLAETEDILAKGKNTSSAKDDAMEKQYDDIGWDEVMEM